MKAWGKNNKYQQYSIIKSSYSLPIRACECEDILLNIAKVLAVRMAEISKP